MINGEAYAWEGVTVKMAHGTLFDVVNIEYKDERKVNRLRGKGSRTRAYSRGPSEGTGTLEMRREEYERMVKSFPKGIYSGKPFTTTVSYAADGQPTVADELQECLFNSRDFGNKEGDESAMVKLGFDILGDLADGGRSPFPEAK